MASLMRREPRATESVDLFDRFDRMFDEWTRELPVRWPALAARWSGTGMIPVDEYQDEDTLVVREQGPELLTLTDKTLTVV